MANINIDRGEYEIMKGTLTFYRWLTVVLVITNIIFILAWYSLTRITGVM